jgi:hypothetical protein
MPVQQSTKPPIKCNNLESIMVPIVSNVPPNTINKNVVIALLFVSCIGDKDEDDANCPMASPADLNSLLERPSIRTDIL